MSKEMIELADRIESTPAYTPEEMGTALPVRQCDSPPGSGKRGVRVILVHEQYRAAIAAALRASAVAEPVAKTDAEHFGDILKTEAARLRAMADRFDPAPAAPVPASELDIRSICGSTKDERCVEVWFGHAVTAADRAALASLPAPEAEPTREEIIEQCAKIARQYVIDTSASQLDDRDISWIRAGADRASDEIADAILALKAAPAK